MQPPPTSLLIDAPRQSNRQTLLRTPANPAIITAAATQDSHPDCRAPLTQIVALQAKPLGKVGTEVSPEQGYASAQLVALAHLASLKRAVGNLDRVTAWLRVFAMVNVAPGFNETPLVTNGYSDLILELYGPDAGAHARSSIGMAIPLNAPINCEAEVEIDG